MNNKIHKMTISIPRRLMPTGRIEWLLDGSDYVIVDKEGDSVTLHYYHDDKNLFNSIKSKEFEIGTLSNKAHNLAKYLLESFCGPIIANQPPIISFITKNYIKLNSEKFTIKVSDWMIMFREKLLIIPIDEKFVDELKMSL